MRLFSVVPKDTKVCKDFGLVTTTGDLIPSLMYNQGFDIVEVQIPDCRQITGKLFRCKTFEIIKTVPFEEWYNEFGNKIPNSLLHKLVMHCEEYIDLWMDNVIKNIPFEELKFFTIHCKKSISKWNVRVQERIASHINEKIPILQSEFLEEVTKTGILNIEKLAKALDIKNRVQTLPSGETIIRLIWEGGDLKKIAKLLHNNSSKFPAIVKVDGKAPAWLVSAITHELHPCAVALNSPDGFITVGCRRPFGVKGEGIEFSTTMKNGWKVVEFKLDPATPLDPAMLSHIAPPDINMGERVIISGRGPNWLVASIAMSYHGKAKAVACFQPKTGSTVCLTHSTTVELGSVISE